MINYYCSLNQCYLGHVYAYWRLGLSHLQLDFPIDEMQGDYLLVVCFLLVVYSLLLECFLLLEYLLLLECFLMLVSSWWLELLSLLELLLLDLLSLVEAEAENYLDDSNYCDDNHDAKLVNYLLSQLLR